MTLETVLKPFSLFARFAQMGNDEPPPSGMKRRLHWVGHKEPVEQKQAAGGKSSGQDPKQQAPVVIAILPASRSVKYMMRTSIMKTNLCPVPSLRGWHPIPFACCTLRADARHVRLRCLEG